jgi:plasmid stability protein
MATLYAENIPNDRYEALRKRAKQNRRSVAAEILSLLEEHVPTEKEMKSWKESVRRLEKLKFTSTSDAPMPDSLELIREDRDR